MLSETCYYHVSLGIIRPKTETCCLSCFAQPNALNINFSYPEKQCHFPRPRRKPLPQTKGRTVGAAVYEAATAGRAVGSVRGLVSQKQ